MRFTHTADCHIGGHRDSRLKQLTEDAFTKYVDDTIAKQVDFTIIAGDLFNTAIPGIDTLKFTVTQLQRLKQNNIPVYAIPGSHDFSPNGKTMLDVLEEAELLINVCKGTVTEDNKLKLSFTQDKKTKVKLTGVIGKKGMLDRQIYEELDQSISNEIGFKIFLFHTSITELKADHLEQMQSYPVSFLPKNFDYYAGGHVHIVEHYNEPNYKNVIYPGPLFPNSFSELEKLQHGGYYLYDDGKIIYIPISLKKVITINIDAKGIDSNALNHKLQTTLSNAQVDDTIVLLRIQGMLENGSISNIAISENINSLEQRGAYIVLRNTSHLTTKEFEQIAISSHDSTNHLEERLIEEHKKDLELNKNDGSILARHLLQALSKEPQEGEKLADHQDRIAKEGLAILDAFTKNE